MAGCQPILALDLATRIGEEFAQPWMEFVFALIGAIGILATGQLWSRGIRLPSEGLSAQCLVRLTK